MRRTEACILALSTVRGKNDVSTYLLFMLHDMESLQRDFHPDAFRRFQLLSAALIPQPGREQGCCCQISDSPYQSHSAGCGLQALWWRQLLQLWQLPATSADGFRPPRSPSHPPRSLCEWQSAGGCPFSALFFRWMIHSHVGSLFGAFSHSHVWLPSQCDTGFSWTMWLW